MAKGVKTGGRVKGTPNKSTAAVKTALTEAFDKLGGTAALVAWAQSDPAEFYKLWAKLLPAEVKNTHEGGIVIQVSTGIVHSPEDGHDA